MKISAGWNGIYVGGLGFVTTFLPLLVLDVLLPPANLCSLDKPVRFEARFWTSHIDRPVPRKMSFVGAT